jgi:hypothetical protein
VFPGSTSPTSKLHLALHRLWIGFLNAFPIGDKRRMQLQMRHRDAAALFKVPDQEVKNEGCVRGAEQAYCRRGLKIRA